MMAKTERHKQMRSRNYTVAGLLVACVILFFILSIVKMSGGG